MRRVVAVVMLALIGSLIPVNSVTAVGELELWDTAWSLPNKATPAEVETYFDHLSEAGFAGVWVMLAPHYWQGGLGSPNHAGEAMESFSSPNPAYFEFMDFIFDEAAERGLQVATAIAWSVDYAGTRPGTEGKPLPPFDDWFDPDDPGVSQKAYDYGFLVGSRWRGHAGLHSWVLGGDYWDGDTEVLTEETYVQMAAGLEAAGATEPVTYAPGGYASSWHRFADAAWVDYVSFNHHCLAPTDLQHELEVLAVYGKPVWAIEVRYEAELAPWCEPTFTVTAQDIADDVAATVAAAAEAYVFGHADRWAWDPGALASLGSPGELAAIDVLYPPVEPPPTSEVVLVEADGRWHVRVDGQPDWVFWYGVPGDTPLLGDWDGDGISTPGMYRPSNGFAYLTNASPADGSVAIADPALTFFYGNLGDQVFVGDWDGDGADSLAIQRNGRLFLRNSNTTGVADIEFWFGQPGDVAFGGNSVASRPDEVFIYRPSTGMIYFTSDLPGGGVATAAGSFSIGSVDGLAFGDWDGDEIDTPGMMVDGSVRLKNTNGEGPHDVEYSWGQSGWTVVGGVLAK